MSEISPPEPREELLARLGEAQRRQSTQTVLLSQTVAARAGINPVDLECLDILQLEGSLPAGRLAKKSGLGSATMTAVLDRLERTGFITRDRSGADRRVVMIHIAPKALEVIGPCYGSLERKMALLCSSLEDRDVQAILRFTTASVEAVREAIEELRGDA